jgi:hypothetical protein
MFILALFIFVVYNDLMRIFWINWDF